MVRGQVRSATAIGRRKVNKISNLIRNRLGARGVKTAAGGPSSTCGFF
jgi:hypothetical protein